MYYGNKRNLWTAESILVKAISKSPHREMLRTCYHSKNSLSIFFFQQKREAPQPLCAALWFQSSGAISMYYLFAAQVKCMHKLLPKYNGTWQNKLRTSKNNFLIPRQDDRKRIFVTVYHIYHLPGFTVQTRGSHNQLSLHALRSWLAWAKVLPLPKVVQQSINGLKQHCYSKLFQLF